MSILADSTSLIAGSIVASVYAGLGATGAAIKAAGATGEHGAGVALNDGLLDASEYLFEVVSQPAGGTATLSELGLSTITVPADGTYTWGYRLREDGVVLSPDPVAVTVTVGAAAITGVAANCAQPNACSTGAGTVSAPGITGAASNCVQSNTSLSAAGDLMPEASTPEPVTLAEAKLAARLDASDTTMDALVMGLVTSAREQAEHITGRLYVPTVVQRDLAGWPSPADVLPVHGPRSVAISYWTGSAWAVLDGAAYVYAAAGAGTVIAPALGSNWPTLGAAALGPLVQVSITAGPEIATTAPEAVKLYIKAVVAFWVDNPTAAAGRGDPGDQLHRLLDRERIWA